MEMKKPLLSDQILQNIVFTDIAMELKIIVELCFYMRNCEFHCKRMCAFVNDCDGRADISDGGGDGFHQKNEMHSKLFAVIAVPNIRNNFINDTA